MRLIEYCRIAVCASAICLGASSALSQFRNAPRPILTNPNAPTVEPRQAGTRHHELYTALEFNVWTGDDDLRAYSGAWVDITFPGEKTRKCVLHEVAEDSWENGSKHQGHQCVLATPRTWPQLKAARMFLNFDGRRHQHPYDTGDNWNVDEVRVIAIDTADKHFPCLLDAKNGPYLVRLTLSHTSYELTETVNRC